MAELETQDRAHALMMQAIVERGYALHYTEMAHAFGLAPEEGKALLHALLGAGIPAWRYDDTDYVASYAPFNNVPTQYRISVEGRPGWFGQ